MNFPSNTRNRPPEKKNLKLKGYIPPPLCFKATKSRNSIRLHLHSDAESLEIFNAKWAE